MQANTVKNTTRGGQIFLHNVRMISQVLKQVLMWALPLWIMVSVVCFYFTTDARQRYIGKQWLNAHYHLLIDSQPQLQVFIKSDGALASVLPEQLVNAPFVKDVIDIFSQKIAHSFWMGGIGYLISILLILRWLQKRGNKHTTNKPIKGDYFAKSLEVKQLIEKQKNKSTLTLGIETIPLPAFSEFQHLYFHGSTGSGKSTAIKALLDQLRKRGDKVFIYDKGCSFVKEFFDPAQDILMNALDERSVDWSIWQECRDKAEFESLAAALIPMPPTTQDPFWINAARTIFAAAANRMRKEKKPKILHLLRFLLTADLPQLQALLKGTEAETLMSEKTEKTAISIKSVLATYLKSLCYIQDGNQPFSIREWVHDDKTNNWLFVSSLGDKHESLKPLITAWLDICINASLSLPENANRHLWIFLDELSSLHQIPSLIQGLSEGRKFGLCFVIGSQTNAQQALVYGPQGAQVISSMVNTRLMFRMPDPEIAHWASINLGETVIEEVREGISYGANTIRDGVSINRVETRKPVITKSEIMRLENLACYLRLAGEYPITKIHFERINRPEINQPFIQRKIEQDDLQGEVLKIVENFETHKPANTLYKTESDKSAKDKGNLQHEEVTHVFD